MIERCCWENINSGEYTGHYEYAHAKEEASMKFSENDSVKVVSPVYGKGFESRVLETQEDPDFPGMNWYRLSNGEWFTEDELEQV